MAIYMASHIKMTFCQIWPGERLYKSCEGDSATTHSLIPWHNPKENGKVTGLNGDQKKTWDWLDNKTAEMS